MIDLGGQKRLRLHRREQFGRMDRFAVVADAAGGFGELRRQLRLTGRHQRPAVDEDLRADLFGDGLPIGRDRSRMRSRHAALEVEPGRVLGRIAVAAPPQDGSLLDDRVEPSLADVLGREVRA